MLLGARTGGELVRIVLETPDSGYHHARSYFESRGLRLGLSPTAVHTIAREAARENRLGARALKEVGRRVVLEAHCRPKPPSPRWMPPPTAGRLFSLRERADAEGAR